MDFLRRMFDKFCGGFVAKPASGGSASSGDSSEGWYFAEDEAKGLRQIVLTLGPTSQSGSRFDNLVVQPDKYGPLLNDVATGFFRMHDDAGTFLMIKTPDFAKAAGNEKISVAFTFCHMPSGPLFVIFVHSASIEKNLPGGCFIDQVYSMDERSGFVDLITDAFAKSELYVVFAESGGMAGIKCVVDGQYVMEKSMLEKFWEEWGKLVAYGESIGDWGSSVGFQQSVDELYEITPVEECPILSRNISDKSRSEEASKDKSIQSNAIAEKRGEARKRKDPKQIKKLMADVKCFRHADSSLVAALKLEAEYGLSTAFDILIGGLISEKNGDTREAISDALKFMLKRVSEEDEVSLSYVKRAAERLAPHLSDQRYLVRSDIAEMLGIMGGLKAIESLLRVAASDDCMAVRLPAVISIKEINDAEANKALKRTLKTNKSLKTAFNEWKSTNREYLKHRGLKW